MFTTSNPGNFDEALRYVTEKVTTNINESLIRAPTDEEIKKALFAINPDKAPGPDGMTSLFYQKFWGITAGEIFRMVREFFMSETLDPRLNQTNICLIPKTERPCEMTEFRPISLCNVSYKVVSKILSNRLKRHLPGLISETQSAFVAKRLITDNILVAQEIFHALRTNPSCKSKFVAIKTDMSKAYDRVEWSFLEALMRKMGFTDRWIAWIHLCISSVSYNVLINGEPKGNITPSRGIRQGDPLSPFLFIILTEALISQIQGAEREGRITGLKIARDSPPISHLLFADDSLFFCKADTQQCRELMKIIEEYGRASGQLLNVAKSSIFFGSKVPPELKTELKEALGITREGGMGVYLGLPEKICGSKRQAFAFIQERLMSRLNSWSAKLLSKGGKEVLIKSVAQALPSYVMSCFLLPQDIIKKLTSAIARFWWSTKQSNRGLHWVAWNKICLPTEKGGLGFRDLKNFNLALLAKQLWRLVQYPTSLLAKVLKGRYFRNSNPIDVEKASQPSYVWRSIMAAKPLLKSGLRKSIGSGYNTRVWDEPWIPSTPPRPPTGVAPIQKPNLLVYELIDRETKSWNVEALKAVIAPEDIPLISSLRISRSFKVDSFCWIHTKSGAYSVKTGYDEICRSENEQNTELCIEPSVTSLINQVWATNTARKIKHFMWQALSNCVSVCSRLTDRHCHSDRSCQRCGHDDETVNHMLFECPPATQTWALALHLSLQGEFPSPSIYSNFDYLLNRIKKQDMPDDVLARIPWIIWFMWKSRNGKVFECKDLTPLEILQSATSEADSWSMAHVTPERREEEDGTPLPATQDSPSMRPFCRFDASWKDDDARYGGGFVMEKEDGIPMFGSFASNQVLSPLHAEFNTLLWAMKSSLLLGHDSMTFESDCLQLVKLIE